MNYPDELPEKPEGWTRHMVVHFNYGSKGGAAQYSIKDASGKKTPIGYQYDTRKGGLTGFTLPDVDGVLTWFQLREKWPEWLKTHRGDSNA